jgi:hypothetical protein
LSDASVSIGLHQCVALTLNLFHDVYVYGVLGVLVEAMTIDPSTHTHRGHQQSSDDDTAGCLHSVLAGSAGECNQHSASEWITREASDGAAELRVDGELHWLVG